jgi:hypothetical protein
MFSTHGMQGMHLCIEALSPPPLLQPPGERTPPANATACVCAPVAASLLLPLLLSSGHVSQQSIFYRLVRFCTLLRFPLLAVAAAKAGLAVILLLLIAAGQLQLRHLELLRRLLGGQQLLLLAGPPGGALAHVGGVQLGRLPLCKRM